MKGLLFLVVLVAVIVYGFRYLRRREVEAFLDADMVDFHTFKQKKEKGVEAPDPLLARAEAYTAMNPTEVPVRSSRTADNGDVEDELVPALAPDPNLYRLKVPGFDEISRNMMQLLTGIVPDDVVVLASVPLSEFVETEAAEAKFKLDSHRVGYLVCESKDLTILCGVQMRDAATPTRGIDFVKTVFGDIGRPLLEFPLSNDISELEIRDQLDPVLLVREARRCPRCGKSMSVRRAQKGKRAGEAFWVCTRFPDCRGVISV
jgi:hypothetical protein